MEPHYIKRAPILLRGNLRMSLPLWASGIPVFEAEQEYAGGFKTLNSNRDGGCAS